MEKKKYKIGLLFVCVFWMAVSCSDSFDPTDDLSGLNDPIHNFIWQGMNSWYNWNEESSKLDNTKDKDLVAYHSFLNGYNDYRDLMYDLCYKHYTIVGTENAVDRYSWFIDDYVAQNNAFQGIRTRYGFTQRTISINNEGDVVIAILLVEQNSPAALAGMKRGDIINAINGTVLNENNIDTAISGLSNESVTLSFVSERDGVLTKLGDKTMSKGIVAANPIHFYKIFDNIGGKKVGYLLYNQFSDSYNDELNAAFAEFKRGGITELVLDLRFNRGGSGLATTYLGSMIYGQAGRGIFYKTIFNSKHSKYNSLDRFRNVLQIQNTQLDVIGEESINRLNTLDRLYVLTTGSTASASELLINGLLPYMSSIKLIGTVTEGKNVGSITLYDSPGSDYLSEEDANPDHTFAMQPICIQVFNKNDESDYLQGFKPDIELDEVNNWNQILPFGDRNEAMLKVALDDISGIASKRPLTKFQLQAKEIKSSFHKNKFDNEMYFNHIVLSKVN